MIIYLNYLLFADYYMYTFMGLSPPNKKDSFKPVNNFPARPIVTAEGVGTVADRQAEPEGV